VLLAFVRIATESRLFIWIWRVHRICRPVYVSGLGPLSLVAVD
jgi:hypothetical protein